MTKLRLVLHPGCELLHAFELPNASQSEASAAWRCRSRFLLRQERLFATSQSIAHTGAILLDVPRLMIDLASTPPPTSERESERDRAPATS